MTHDAQVDSGLGAAAGDELVVRGRVTTGRHGTRVPGPAWLPPAAVGVLVIGAAIVAALLPREPPHPSEDAMPPPFRGSVVPGPGLPGRLAAAVVLAGGDVLLVGGDGTASVLDPGTGATTLAGPGAPAGEVAGIGLADGRVLLVAYRAPATSTVAVFDPSDGSFHDVALPDRRTVIDPTLTRLADGRILVSGGRSRNYAPEGSYPAQNLLTPRAMVFDPASGRLDPTGDMLAARQFHAAIALPDGRVLIAGGTGPADAELYEPAGGRFTAAGATSPVDFATRGVLLPDGRVLVVHWTRDPSTRLPAREPVAMFDPLTGRFATAAPVPGAITTATGLRDGRVLVTGVMTMGSAGVRPWSGIYDPADGLIREVALLPGRVEDAQQLPDGRILLLGRPAMWTLPGA